VSTRHQASRRRSYGRRRHELIERTDRHVSPDRARPDRDEPVAELDLDIGAAVAFLYVGAPAPHALMGD
jgi:hypothetical protein